MEGTSGLRLFGVYFPHMICVYRPGKGAASGTNCFLSVSWQERYERR
jgi:hypothetical protein